MQLPHLQKGPAWAAEQVHPQGEVFSGHSWGEDLLGPTGGGGSGGHLVGRSLPRKQGFSSVGGRNIAHSQNEELPSPL